MFNLLVLNEVYKKASRNLLASINGALAEPELVCIMLILNVYFLKF